MGKCDNCGYTDKAPSKNKKLKQLRYEQARAKEREERKQKAKQNTPPPKPEPRVLVHKPEDAQIKPGKMAGRKKKPKKITLYSKRGTKVEGRHACDRCMKVVDNPHRYSKSSIGPVILCATCKMHLLKVAKIRSGDAPDALDRAKSGGGFETNKRRH